MVRLIKRLLGILPSAGGEAFGILLGRDYLLLIEIWVKTRMKNAPVITQIY